MPFCPQCGSESAGNFCASCGASIGAPGAPPKVDAPPPPPVPQAGLDQNLAAALCYLPGAVVGVLFLLIEPYNRDKTVRFHAFQSIFAHVAMFVGWFILTILAYLPIINLLAAFLMVFAYPLMIAALWIILTYKAYQGERLVLPIVGPLAERQA